MGAKSHWGMTPRESVEQECALRGERAVVSGCIAMLRGRAVDGDLIMALGGPPADWVRTGGESGPDYWLRVWAARGLLYAWHGSARGAVRSALEDEAWRVREMAVRVVAERKLREERALVQARCHDDSSRVRAAAVKASSSWTPDATRSRCASCTAHGIAPAPPPDSLASRHQAPTVPADARNAASTSCSRRRVHPRLRGAPLGRLGPPRGAHRPGADHASRLRRRRPLSTANPAPRVARSTSGCATRSSGAGASRTRSAPCMSSHWPG